jgi:hypothetical protein
MDKYTTQDKIITTKNAGTIEVGIISPFSDQGYVGLGVRTNSSILSGSFLQRVFTLYDRNKNYQDFKAAKELVTRLVQDYRKSIKWGFSSVPYKLKKRQELNKDIYTLDYLLEGVSMYPPIESMPILSIYANLMADKINRPLNKTTDNDLTKFLERENISNFFIRAIEECVPRIKNKL